MMTQIERARLFKKLHIKGDPLILFNIWDAGSALALQEIGAKAIATGSWSVAASQGYQDGEKVPLDLVLANLERIIASVNLPVTLDFEGGYGKTPAEVRDNVAKVIQAGAVGINFEDRIVPGRDLYSVDDQCARLEAIREAADNAGIPFFLNARTDVFLETSSAEHQQTHLDEAIRRVSAYAKSGASGFFVPGLKNEKYIEKLCEVSSLPVNVMMLADMPSSKQLAELGVARISYGPIPYRLAIDTLKEEGRKALTLT